jgi:hypothetical protein
MTGGSALGMTGGGALGMTGGNALGMTGGSALGMTGGGAVVMTLLLSMSCLAIAQTPPPAGQNPSPMVEHTRAHERIEPRELAGVRRSFEGPLGKPVDVFVPERSRRADALDLVIHFHGGAFLPEYAVSQLGGDAAVAVVNLAPGSGVYDRTFREPAVYDSLLASVRREAAAGVGHAVTFRTVTLVGFSAGHGAVRAILRDSSHFAHVDAVLLIDGLHTSYVPEGTVLEKGGALDTTNLVAFTRFAREAMRGTKRFLITHSEIFPGTFASTTETTDYLVEHLGLKRTPVLEWGARGLQQLSDVRQGAFEIMGFAGNSAPDHIDQFQAMPELLQRLRSLR